MKFPWQKLTQDDVDHSFTDKSLPGEYDDQYVLLQKINKVYSNKFHAVHDFSLCVKKKEFVVFVGPSGCGKSTTLRMIAGLEDISSGNLFINGEYANNLLAKDRDIAMVFQNYALYPNMTVFDNMAFALKVRKHDFPVVKLTNEELYKKEVEETINQLEAEKNEEIAQLKLNGATKEDVKDYLYLYGLYKKLTIRYIRKKYEVQVMTFDHEEVKRLNFVLKDEKNPNKVEEIKNKIASIKANLNVPQFKRRHYKKEEIIDRVYNAANILEIFDQLKKKPKELSGGQRQRVALGRAIVRNAKIFLMDEPLSNLDAKLRVQMRSEIIELHKKINATTIYVTHDQTEAMTMADRIVVMKDGYIQQIGTPMEIYQHPRNLFVASFIGSPAMNILEGTYNCGSITFPDGTTIKLNEDIIKKHDEFYAQKYANETNNYSAFKEQLMEEKTLFDSKKHSGKEIEEFYGKYNKLIQDKDELIANLKKIIHNEPHDIIFGIRPESIVESEEKGSMKVNVRLSELLGDQYFVHFDFGGKDILSKVSADKLIPSGVTMSLLISEDKIHLFDAYSKMTIV